MGGAQLIALSLGPGGGRGGGGECKEEIFLPSDSWGYVDLNP